MPSLGADMQTGTITRWLVHPGDPVHRGDIVAVVQTDKSDIEVEIFEDGIIQELAVPEGVRVSVGTVLALVTTNETPAHDLSAPTASTAVVSHATPVAPVVSVGVAGPSQGHLVESPLVRRLARRRDVDLATLAGTGMAGVITRADVEAAAAALSRATGGPPRHRSSPYARRVAEQLGVDLESVVGSGPAGAILEGDVRAAVPRAVEPAATVIAPTREERRRSMQRAIGALMSRSKREVPHYYLDSTIDLSAASDWLERTNIGRAVADRLVMAALLFCATARAVARVPEMNGFFVDGDFTPSVSVNLGVAISQRGGGLIAPAIHDAQTLSPDEMMARVTDLVGRARTGALRSSELSDSTITVTNLGDLGVDRVFGVIYPPQVALVGFGRVRECAWASQGLIGARPCVAATLSGDHRVSDGMRGARFLSEVERLLREPERL